MPLGPTLCSSVYDRSSNPSLPICLKNSGKDLVHVFVPNTNVRKSFPLSTQYVFDQDQLRHLAITSNEDGSAIADGIIDTVHCLQRHQHQKMTVRRSCLVNLAEPLEHYSMLHLPHAVGQGRPLPDFASCAKCLWTHPRNDLAIQTSVVTPSVLSWNP